MEKSFGFNNGTHSPNLFIVLCNVLITIVSSYFYYNGFRIIFTRTCGYNLTFFYEVLVSRYAHVAHT
jgi:hypothetical protein